MSVQFWRRRAGRAREGPLMSVLVSLWLFGKPGQELNEGGEVTADEVRALARDLSAHLEHVADILDKMTRAGWDAQMALYDIMLSHPYVRTESEARSRLDELGIDPDEVSLMEFEDEEDEEPFGEENEE
jgi:hypothetical protein